MRNVFLLMFGCASKMAAKETMNEAIEKVLKKFNIPSLKREQRQILQCLVNLEDCLAVLPTGFGKSLPFQMAIPVRREMGMNVGKILVCCPLISLMQDQVAYLRSISNLTAAYKGWFMKSYNAYFVLLY